MNYGPDVLAEAEFRQAAATLPDFLIGGGDMARLVAETDWSQTPLGPLENWPQAFRTAVSLCLATPAPAAITWGHTRAHIYNDAYRRVLRLNTTDTLGQNYRAAFSSECATLEQSLKLAEQGEAQILENPPLFIPADGNIQEAFYTFSFTPIRAEHGVQGVFHTLTDNTARIQSEGPGKPVAEIERQWHVFDTALSNIPDHVFIFDTNLRGIYANHAALSMWNRSAEEWQGRTLRELGLPGDLASLIEQRMQAAMERRAKVESEFEIDGISDETVYFEAVYVPILDSQGSVQAIAGSARDVTERKRTENREKRLQGMRDESARLESLGVLAGGIAHDFNNLLTGVLGNAGLLVDRLSGRERQIANQIVLSAELAATLIRQMLAFAGKATFQIQEFDLNELIRENFTLLSASIPRNIILRPELCREACFIRADRSQMQQVVMNFLINAADAIGSGAGMITVRTRHREITDTIIGGDTPRAEMLPGRYVCLEVVDDGVGMSPETEKKIFDPFFTTKAAGRGLGLAAVMGIIKAHKGAIQVTTALGVGTTFRVFLPTINQEVATPVAEVSADTDSFRPEDHTVLVVDDDKVVRQLAEAILNVHGYHVLMAANGAKALECLASNPQVSAVLLDLTMPVMTGEQAIPKIKELRPDVAIVLSSGYDEGEVALRFAGAALSGFLQKPYSSKVMIAAIEQAIRDHLAKAGG